MKRSLTTALGVLMCVAGADALAAGQWSESREEVRNERDRRADHGERGNRGRQQQEQSRGNHDGGSRNYGGSRSSGPSGFQGVAVEPRPDTRRQYGGDDRRADHGADRGGNRHNNDWRDNRHDNRHDSRYGRNDQRGRNDYDHNRHYDNRHDNRWQDHRRHDRYVRQHNNWRHADWRRSWHHGWSGSRYRAPARYYYPRGYNRSYWRVGYSIPLAFLISSYYVDYRPYGLSAPPYGCRWLRVDGDLLLVELATGAIVDILYDFYY